MCVLQALSDAARLRAVPCHPHLDAGALDAAVTAVDKLLTQFVREGAVGAGGCTGACEGGFLLIAWDETAGPLSGCRLDKIDKVLADQERRSGSDLLVPPPICLHREGRPHCVTHAGLRALVAAGEVDRDSRAYDHLVTSLGAWRAGMPRPVADIPWLAGAVVRLAS